MTDAQALALAAMAGRDLTDEESATIAEHLLTGNVGAIATLLSAGRTKLGTVSVGDFASWAAATGMRAVIEDHATNTQSPLRSIALALRDVLGGNIGGIRLDLQGNVDMLAAWVSADLLSVENRDALLALASVDDPLTVDQVAQPLGDA